MAQDKCLLLDMNDLVSQYMDKIYPDSDGGFYRVDWARVESTATGKPVYDVKDDLVSGSFSARSQTLTNKTSRDQKFDLSESVMTSNKCCVQVHGGVQPGAAPVHLEMPPKLKERGLPPILRLTGSDDGAVEEVKWTASCSVLVPSKRTVIASICGSELRLKGTFSQKTRLTGEVIVRRFKKGGVMMSMLYIPLNELINEDKPEATLDELVDSNSKDELKESIVEEKPGMTLVSGGIEYTLKGNCDFHITVDSSVQLDEVKNPR